MEKGKKTFLTILFFQILDFKMFAILKLVDSKFDFIF